MNKKRQFKSECPIPDERERLRDQHKGRLRMRLQPVRTQYDLSLPTDENLVFNNTRPYDLHVVFLQFTKIIFDFAEDVSQLPCEQSRSDLTRCLL